MMTGVYNLTVCTKDYVTVVTGLDLNLLPTGNGRWMSSHATGTAVEV